MTGTGKSHFLNRKPIEVLRIILYDYVSFMLFIVFLLICILIGRPLYAIDKALNTRNIERLIRLFEFFAL